MPLSKISLFDGGVKFKKEDIVGIGNLVVKNTEETKNI